MICQHSTFFFRALGFIYLEVILFLYPTVPFPDLFKSCGVLGSPRSKNNKCKISRSRSTYQNPWSLKVQWHVGSTPAAGLTGRFWTNKNSGGQGVCDEATHVCFPPKKGLKVFWCQGANPKNIKKKTRNNTWSWMNWDVWWVIFFGGDGLGLSNASSARLFWKPDPDERLYICP